jgi:hypothetical protein
MKIIALTPIRFGNTSTPLAPLQKAYPYTQGSEDLFSKKREVPIGDGVDGVWVYQEPIHPELQAMVSKIVEETKFAYPDKVKEQLNNAIVRAHYDFFNTGISGRMVMETVHKHADSALKNYVDKDGVERTGKWPWQRKSLSHPFRIGFETIRQGLNRTHSVSLTKRQLSDIVGNIAGGTELIRVAYPNKGVNIYNTDPEEREGGVIELTPVGFQLAALLNQKPLPLPTSLGQYRHWVYNSFQYIALSRFCFPEKE